MSTDPVDLDALERDVLHIHRNWPQGAGQEFKDRFYATLAELRELRETTILLRQENKFLEKEIDQLRERAKDLA